MKLFVSFPKDRPAEQHLGDFITPARWSWTPRHEIWAADNGAFAGFDPAKFEAMCQRIRTAPTPPKFVTLPDVVGDYDATLQMFGHWHRRLAAHDLPRAFVLQNGSERHGWKAVPWDYVEAIFIGGDTEYKFTPHVREVVAYARAMGKWVHMGRVNSVKRLRYACEIGCDSCDGSGMAKFSSTLLPRLGRYLDQRAEELFLFS